MKLIRFLGICLLAVLWVVAAGCADDDDDDDDDNDDSPPDDEDDDDDDDDTSGPTRPFFLASTGVQFEVTDDSARILFDFNGFEDRLDAVSLHMDSFYGLPWDAFIQDTDPPSVWVDEMELIRQKIQALGVVVYLSLTPIGGTRNTLSSKAYERSGELFVDTQWITGCYNFDTAPDAPAIRQAYLRYVRWMVDFFTPDFLTNGIEINLYGDFCPDEYASLGELLNEAYDQEKALDPERPIFPTFTAASMWGFGGEGECFPGDRSCLLANLAKQKDIRRDRFGISSYPIFLQWEWEGLPDDFYTAFAEETGEQVVFGEIGWGCRDVVVPYPEPGDPCMTVLQSSIEDQIAFLEQLFDVADQMDSDLLVWWSLRDFLFDQILSSCPCDAPGVWCVIYDEFGKIDLLAAWLMWGSMGVIDYEGDLKPSFGVWWDWLSRPIRTTS